MDNQDTEKLSTQHGLKYYLSTDLIDEANGLPRFQRNATWKVVGVAIESAEIFSHFLTMLALIISMIYRADRVTLLLVSAGGYIIGSLLSRSVSLFTNKLFLMLMITYEIISKFFIDVLIALALTIFVTNDYLSLIIVVGFVYLSTLLFSGSYRSRLNFNNAVMRHYLGRLGQNYFHE